MGRLTTPVLFALWFVAGSAGRPLELWLLFGAVRWGAACFFVGCAGLFGWLLCFLHLFVLFCVLPPDDWWLFGGTDGQKEPQKTKE